MRCGCVGCSAQARMTADGHPARRVTAAELLGMANPSQTDSCWRSLARGLGRTSPPWQSEADRWSSPRRDGLCGQWPLAPRSSQRVECRPPSTGDGDTFSGCWRLAGVGQRSDACRPRKGGRAERGAEGARGGMHARRNRGCASTARYPGVPWGHNRAERRARDARDGIEATARAHRLPTERHTSRGHGHLVIEWHPPRLLEGGPDTRCSPPISLRRGEAIASADRDRLGSLRRAVHGAAAVGSRSRPHAARLMQVARGPTEATR